MSELKLYTPIPATTLFPSVQSEPRLRCSVEWNTLIREAQRKGKENRTAKLSEPRFSIDGADFILSDEDYDNFAQAFIDKDGKVTGFPFKFPLDYYTTKDPEYYDTTAYQQGVLTQLTTTTFQACKKYCVSSISSYKTLNNLVNGTIAVYKDNVLQTSGITVNLTTGVLTFSVAPTGVLTLACEHRPNFRFDVDDLQLTQIKKAVVSGDRNVFKSVNFKLVEDNYAKLSPLNSGDWNSNISYDLSPYATNTTYSDRVLSFVESGDNKREIREGFDVTRKLIKLESSNANWKRTQLYYTLFNVAKGRLLSFDFNATQVRFDQDVFTSEQLGINAWTFDGLSMIETLFSSSVEVKNYAHFIKIEAFPQAFYYSPRFVKVWFDSTEPSNPVIPNFVAYAGGTGLYGFDTPFTVNGFWKATFGYSANIWRGPIINGVNVSGGIVRRQTSLFYVWGGGAGGYPSPTTGYSWWFTVREFKKVIGHTGMLQLNIALSNEILTTITSVVDRETGTIYTEGTHYTINLILGVVAINYDSNIIDSTGLDIFYQV